MVTPRAAIKIEVEVQAWRTEVLEGKEVDIVESRLSVDIILLSWTEASFDIDSSSDPALSDALALSGSAVAFFWASPFLRNFLVDFLLANTRVLALSFYKVV